MKLSAVCLFVLMFVANVLAAQKHLVFLKRGHIIARFAEGQYIRLKLKNGKRSEGHILELNTFSMITSDDTIEFKNIRKIDIRKQRNFKPANGIGGLLFLGGIGYLGLDRLNSAIGKGPPNLDCTVLNTSLILTSVGAAMIFIKPRYIRVNYKVNVRVANYDSNLYK